MIRSWIGVSLYELYANLKPQGIMALLIIDPFIYLLLFVPAMRGVIGNVGYGPRSVDYASFVLPGILTMSLLSTSISLCTPLYTARESGEIEVLLSSPVSWWMLLIAKMEVMVIRILVEGLVILGVGSVLVSSFTLPVSNLILSLLIATLFGVGFGLFFLSISSIIINAQIYHLSINLLFLPLLFSSPIFYPSEGMPIWLRVVAKFNPLTFAVEAIRASFFGIGLREYTTSLTGGLVFLVAAVTFARWAFPRAIQ